MLDPPLCRVYASVRHSRLDLLAVSVCQIAEHLSQLPRLSASAYHATLAMYQAHASPLTGLLGGSDRIRTCDGMDTVPPFQDGALDHSATLPFIQLVLGSRFPATRTMCFSDVVCSIALGTMPPVHYFSLGALQLRQCCQAFVLTVPHFSHSQMISMRKEEDSNPQLSLTSLANSLLDL